MNASFGEKFRAIMATGRVANLPTVWSNVIVAYFLAVTLDLNGIGRYYGGDHNFHAWLLGFTLVAGSCLYVGGCMLGDYRDIRFDREHRPGRPLPSGVLSPGFVAISAISLIILGLFSGAAAIPASMIIAFDVSFSVLRSARTDELQILIQPDQLALLGLLVTFIVVYALFHKKSRPFALVNMAMCRTQLVVFSAAVAVPVFNLGIGGLSFHWLWVCAPILVIGLAVGIYTLLLSSVAATESNKNRVKYASYLKILMLFLPLGAVALMLTVGGIDSKVVSTNTSRMFFFLALFLYCCWMLFAFRALPNDKPAFVSRALAGFCLLDACFAATYSVTVPLVCFVLFGIALLLQKIAPAT